MKVKQCTRFIIHQFKLKSNSTSNTLICQMDLKIDESKFNSIIFSTKQSTNITLSIITDKENLAQTSITKFLGLKSDGNLCWQSHIKYSLGKTLFGIFALR